MIFEREGGSYIFSEEVTKPRFFKKKVLVFELISSGIHSTLNISL